MRTRRLSAPAAFTAVLLALGATTASAAPGLAAQLKTTPAATVTMALKASHLEACRGTWMDNTPTSTPCQLAVAEAVLAAPVKDAADVEQRRALIDAVRAATSTPTSPARLAFERHREACGALFAGLRAFDAVPAAAPHKGAAKAALSLAPGITLRSAACTCADDATRLAVGANAAPDDVASVQGMLTANRCLTDGKGFVIGERKDADQVFAHGSEDTRALADQNSPAGRLEAMAQGRLVEMQRCTDKRIKNGRVDDNEKLSKCACGVVKRWALPFKKTDPVVEARLPILAGEPGALVLPVTVEGNAVTTCGPAQGSLLR